MRRFYRPVLFVFLLGAAVRVNAGEHPIQLEKNVDAAKCLECHEDKSKGTHVHSAIAMGCTTCHESHGSVNPRMLTRSRVSQVCLECHSNLPQMKSTSAAGGVSPPAFHNLNIPRFQNCTICHSKVHGSYADRNLLR